MEIPLGARILKTGRSALIWRGSGRATFAVTRRNEGARDGVEVSQGGQEMQDDKSELPEGTDKVISGASTPTSAEGESGDVLLVADVGQPTSRAATRDAIVDKNRTGREKLSSQAADKTRGLVGQGL